MSEPAIIVDGISKRYRIGVATERYPTFREALVGAVKAPIRRWRRLREDTNGDDTIWALKDVSFEVQPGEVLGIIGRNGAGKSTLLKVLSRITEPTEGYAELNGRVASLLEVGTGFHPELTGRENIYLNGAILGMKKVEIDRKFDEIVAFAETEKFLDTPVKRYSSGMYVRLAFAVAAHLEPEILVVDEVLAVGDVEFQKKCLGKMQEVASTGERAVLFVSHNMAAVTRLCTRGLHIEDGRLALDGAAEEAVADYITGSPGSNGCLGANGIHLRVDVLTATRDRLAVWRPGDDIRVTVDCTFPIDIVPAVDLAFYSQNGIRVFAVQSDRLGARPTVARNDMRRFEFRFTNIGLSCRELSLDIGVRHAGGCSYLACWERVAMIAISQRDSRDTTISDTILELPCSLKVE